MIKFSIRMDIIAAQYLESLPPGFTAQQARRCLRRAFDILPLSHILLGWNIPPDIEACVAEETARRGAKLYQWHPLFTSECDAPSIQRAINLKGDPIPGHNNLPEFTFICPNQPSSQEFIAARVEKVIQRGIYQGLFLDRIRFPSPAASPEIFLGCFCEYCRRSAAETGIDLDEVRHQITSMLAEKDRRILFTKSLFDCNSEPDSVLAALLRFRANCVTLWVASICRQLSASGIESGLDCFSPSLAWMVGQDLAALDKVCDWMKIMTYPHTYGPAGLPYELLGLLDWLHNWNTGNELDILRECSGLDLPQTREDLASIGLSSEIIRKEIESGKRMGVKTLLAGLALVDIPGINRVNIDHLEASQNADGIVLSWDLQQISPEILSQLALHLSL
jgi:hypothetical protein